jgi:L-threonylcarbamoyladenylate synthase
MPDIDAQLREAVQRLAAGDVVAFPTETVYGLGADAFSEPAVRRVFELKGRPATNPLIVHVAGEAMARRVVSEWPGAATRLADAFWPGPLTIVLPKSPDVPSIVTGGGPTVGVRCPRHLVALDLLNRFGRPLVGPSANISGHLSPTTAAHVRAEFGDKVLVLDGGPCQAGIESTVVTLAESPARILRPGVVSALALSNVLGEPVLSGRPAEVTQPGQAAPSPGMHERHYSTRTPAVLFDAHEWPRIAEQASGAVHVLAISALSPTAGADWRIIPMPSRATAYANALYAALRTADEARPSLIAIERPPTTAPDDEEAAIWTSIADRLARATAP